MTKNIIELKSPGISEDTIRNLKKGDVVSISGVMVTGRDVAHKYLKDTFISSQNPPESEKLVLENLKKYLDGGILYHCGPVVYKDENNEYKFSAAGPTTSIREEPYEYDVIKLFNLRGVIGKGGMGAKTLKACQEFGSVYLHAIGGAATYTAERVKKVIGVGKLEEFGSPEAFWIIEVENFECVVTMDSHGDSLHESLLLESEKIQKEIMASF
ncbi:MAG: fumarate hydratase C-terminal domain-containing protein [Spirochaetia bacterium]|nr:fumarate hydratase C-terminal domain-containing protein [Spirochaetia bacterium]